MKYSDRILMTKEFYTMEAPRDAKKLYKYTGLPGSPSTSFVEILRELEREEQKVTPQKPIKL